MSQKNKDIHFTPAIFDPIYKLIKNSLNDEEYEEYLSFVGMSDKDHLDTSFRYSRVQAQNILRWYCTRMPERKTIQDLLTGYTNNSLGWVYMAAMSSATVKDALNLITSFLPLYMPAMEASMEERDGEIYLSVDYVVDLEDVSGFAMEIVLGALHMLGQEANQTYVSGSTHFKHSIRPYEEAGITLEEFERLFGHKVYFESSFNGMVFLTEEMESSLASSNKATNDLAIGLLEKENSQTKQYDSYQSKAKNILKKHAANNKYLSLDELATEMLLTVRTLSRKLVEEKTSFKELINDVKFTRAQYLLQHTRKPLKIVALESGFQNGEAFARAFKREFDQTPSQWRNEHQT